MCFNGCLYAPAGHPPSEPPVRGAGPSAEELASLIYGAPGGPGTIAGADYRPGPGRARAFGVPIISLRSRKIRTFEMHDKGWG